VEEQERQVKVSRGNSKETIQKYLTKKTENYSSILPFPPEPVEYAVLID
jgi:hypothetical protein